MSVEAVATESAVTAAEIALQLKCSTDTVYRLAANGGIPGFRVGREWRFYPSVVREHMTSTRDRWRGTSRKRRVA